MLLSWSWLGRNGRWPDVECLAQSGEQLMARSCAWTVLLTRTFTLSPGGSSRWPMRFFVSPAQADVALSMGGTVDPGKVGGTSRCV